MDWEADPPFMPDLTVYEGERGLKHPIGYVRFEAPKKKPARKTRKVVKRARRQR
jgi:hypothetical protein